MRKIFECVVGSHAYGTNIETSDIDIKGVFCQPKDDILGLKYQEQLNPDKDTSYYEIRRFIELAGSANPNILEMLFVDSKFIKTLETSFKYVLDVRKSFLTKQCLHSFGGYAVGQIKKAKGLDKKMNWEKEKTIRKTPLDFCFVFVDGGSINIQKWLVINGVTQDAIGLAAIDRMPGCYSLYIDWGYIYGKTLNKPIPPIGFKGIAFEDSNDIRLSSIPKDHLCAGIMYYNKDAYSIHCKDYNQYQEWLQNRNTQRYIDTQEHGQKIDGKNLMHCMRLINCAMEIGKTGNLTVFRPEAEELLKIRRGQVILDDVIKEAEEKLLLLDDIYKNADLPEIISLEFKHNLLLKCRKKNH